MLPHASSAWIASRQLGGTVAESGLIFLADGDPLKVSAWKGKVSNQKGWVHGDLEWRGV